MADGAVRGAEAHLKTEGRLPRRRGAGSSLKPAQEVSPGSDTQIVDRVWSEARTDRVHDGGGGTGITLKPVRSMPPVAGAQIVDRSGPEARPNRVHDGGGGADESVQSVNALSPAADTPTADTIAALVQLQRQRIFCIRTQSRADRSTDAFIARECLGYHTGLPEAERKALMQQAMRIRLAGEKPLKDLVKRGRTRTETWIARAPVNGRDRMKDEARTGFVPPVDAPEADADGDAGDRTSVGNQHEVVPSDGRDRFPDEAQVATVPPLVAPIIEMSFYARTAADTLRKATERAMERLAAALPVAVWQADIKGFGRLGLAIVVAEAGRDLRCYPTVAKLWKRLGLAVIDGERQRRKADVELAALHGYVPRRRAEVWTLADSMFRHQWSAGKDGEDGAPVGRYGEVYARRRARTAETHPEWTKPHARDDARRVMFKALVADLWAAWHGRPCPTKGGGEHG